MTQLLNGKEVADQLQLEIKKSISALVAEREDVPGLAVILVGENPASKVYVGRKKAVCEQVGIRSFDFQLPSDCSEHDLIDLITDLNQRSSVHGILLQLPLPNHLDDMKMLQLIDPKKDVDGFHPQNVGNLLIGLDTFRSCTPYGVLKIFDHYNIDPEGKHVVIVGRSNIVGKPMAAMLVQKEAGANATVTICHSRSQNMKAICQTADILIAAIGQPRFVTADMVKKGAVVIDVGINRVEDDASPKGYKLVGDVDYEDVFDVVDAITPVPGGVGPLTVTMLMANTMKAFQQSPVSHTH